MRLNNTSDNALDQTFRNLNTVPLSEQEKEEVYKNIKRNIQDGKKPVINWTPFLSYASIITFMAVASIFVISLISTDSIWKENSGSMVIGDNQILVESDDANLRAVIHQDWEAIPEPDTGALHFRVDDTTTIGISNSVVTYHHTGGDPTEEDLLSSAYENHTSIKEFEHDFVTEYSKQFGFGFEKIDQIGDFSVFASETGDLMFVYYVTVSNDTPFFILLQVNDSTKGIENVKKEDYYPYFLELATKIEPKD